MLVEIKKRPIKMSRRDNTIFENLYEIFVQLCGIVISQRFTKILKDSQSYLKRKTTHSFHHNVPEPADRKADI